MNERAFLLNIIENPKDDGPRLVFADWLEEQGEVERAEFIRVQCELAILEETEPCVKSKTEYGCAPFIPKGKCDPCLKKIPLKARQKELMRRNEDRWLGKLAFIGNVGAIIQRGFLCEVSLTEADFLSCAPQLCWHQIEKVTLTDKEPNASISEDQYYWLSDEMFKISDGYQGSLKKELYDSINRWEEKLYRAYGTMAYFPSKEAAVSALEQGCLSYLNSLRTPESCIASDDSRHSGTENKALV